LDEGEVDTILTEIVVNGIMRETPKISQKAPEKGDDHLWALISIQPETTLVTGDKQLIENPPDLTTVLSPRGFIELLEG
jgi:hypothetical protein